MRDGGDQNPLPAIYDVSVTNVCNAACDFCGFSRDKNLVSPRRYIDVSEFSRALPILRRRRIRYLTFQGGEPLVHPEISSLVAAASEAGIHCALIVMMRGVIAVTESAQALARGDVRSAISLLFQRGVAFSLWSLAVEEAPRMALSSPRRN